MLVADRSTADRDRIAVRQRDRGHRGLAEVDVAHRRHIVHREAAEQGGRGREHGGIGRLAAGRNALEREQSAAAAVPPAAGVAPLPPARCGGRTARCGGCAGCRCSGRRCRRSTAQRVSGSRRRFDLDALDICGRGVEQLGFDPKARFGFEGDAGFDAVAQVLAFAPHEVAPADRLADDYGVGSVARREADLRSSRSRRGGILDPDDGDSSRDWRSFPRRSWRRSRPAVVCAAWARRRGNRRVRPPSTGRPCRWMVAVGVALARRTLTALTVFISPARAGSNAPPRGSRGRLRSVLK